MSWIPKQFTDAASQLRSQMTAPQQKADETITKLVEKINTSAEVYDRRTAVLGLKGLSRDMTTQVGEQAFTALLAVLQYDAPNDAEMAKAVLETLGVLCLVPKDVSVTRLEYLLTT
jgi:hypothetical protein